jgi:hypothetical protein
LEVSSIGGFEEDGEKTCGSCVNDVILAESCLLLRRRWDLAGANHV